MFSFDGWNERMTDAYYQAVNVYRSLTGGLTYEKRDNGWRLPLVTVAVSHQDLSTSSPLLKLPTDIWGEITSYFGNSGLDLFHFTLASRITREVVYRIGGVTRLHLDMSHNPSSVTSWPQEKFKAYPHLISIGLILGSRNHLRFKTEELTLFFPETLKRLYFGFVDDLSDKHVPLLPRYLDLLHLEFNSRLTDNSFEFFPQTLTSLHLPNNYHLTPSCLKMLPPNLSSLTIRVNAAIPAPYATLLPPSLTSIEIHSSQRPEKTFLAKLPENIKHFSWMISVIMDQEDITELPNTLISLTFAMGFRNSADPSTRLELLPRNLMRLKLFHGEVLELRHYRNLPSQNLMDLEIVASISITPDIIPVLPKTLTRLSLPKVLDWVDENFSILPPELQILLLPKCNTFTNESFQFLPKTIRIVSIYMNFNISHNCIDYFHDSMEHLVINHCDTDQLFNMESAFPGIRLSHSPKRQRKYEFGVRLVEKKLVQLM